MHTQPVTTDEVRSYIHRSLSTGEPTLSLGDEDDLLDILDSLQVLRLVMQLETTYAIKFDNGDLTPDNLGSIARLVAFVNARR